MEKELSLFASPLEAGIQKSAESMQKELINLKCNTNTIQKFAETGFQEESSRRKFSVLGSFVLRKIAIYSSTYKSVQFFTLMYNNKTKKICFDRWHLKYIKTAISTKNGNTLPVQTMPSLQPICTGGSGKIRRISSLVTL